MKRTVAWIGSLIATGVLSSWLTTYVSSHQVASTSPTTVPSSLLKSQDFQRFVTAYQDIRQNAIWPNSTHQLMVGALNGMVATLHDQFSTYMSKQSYNQLTQMLGGSFTGIGIALDVNQSGQYIILQVFAGTPAQQAGLQANDQIVAVNGKPVAGENSTVVAGEIRGPAGSSVTLTVKQNGTLKTVKVKRAVINTPTVFTEMLPNHVGYMNITEFGYHTGHQVVDAYKQLVQAGAKGILLDLRGNPGGDVQQCQIASGAFVPPGPLVTLDYKNRAYDQTLDSPGPGTKLPVVVLVNGNTASAAEILSAAIQQRHVGILVGTKTYGKGIVQELMQLPGGAYLKLTVAKYLTPNGDYIEHKGLMPNVVVSEPANVQPSSTLGKDPQLDRGYQLLLQKMRTAP